MTRVSRIVELIFLLDKIDDICATLKLPKNSLGAFLIYILFMNIIISRHIRLLKIIFKGNDR